MKQLRPELLPEIDPVKLKLVTKISKKITHYAQGMLPRHRYTKNEEQTITQLLNEYNSITRKSYKLCDFDDNLGCDERSELDLLPDPKKISDLNDEEMCELIGRIREYEGSRTELEYFKKILILYFPCFKDDQLFYLYPEKSAKEILILAKNGALKK